VPSLAEGYRDLRQKLREDGVLAADPGGLLRFTIDYPFDSPSAAASMVTWTNVNLRITWKVKGSGISYKEWQEQQVAGSAA